jgi:ribonuclease HII
MLYVIGTDEAGYGPHLGPLVISATLWQLDDPVHCSDLYRPLRKVVTNDPAKATARRVVMADSKVLYKPGEIEILERGALAALACVGYQCGPWRELWRFLDRSASCDSDGLAWHDGYQLDLPLAVDLKKLAKTAAHLRDGFEECGVRLIGLFSRAVFPAEFNELTESLDNKSETLSRLTLELLGDVLAGLPEAPVIAFCDKHGGRNHYAALLQRQYSEWLVEVHREGCDESVYRFGPPERRIEVSFHVRCERFLPAALASMTAKYLREVFMRPFNDFWCARIPGLRPTAGYPTDSHRFKADIREMQSALGINDRVLWRMR